MKHKRYTELVPAMGGSLERTALNVVPIAKQSE